MKTILLYGMARCGSTWVGEALSACIGAKLISDPFNPQSGGIGIGGYQFRYLAPGAQDHILVDRLLGLMWGGHPLRRLVAPNQRFVIKEVVGVFTAELLAKALGAQVVVILRHPCAVAASWSAFEWNAKDDLRIISSQPALMARYLSKYSDVIDTATTEDANPMFAIGVLWGVLYTVLCGLVEEHGSHWHLTHHEALCRDPERAYKALVNACGFAMNPSGPQYLNQHNRAPTADEAPNATVRDSKHEARKWLSKLVPAQIDQIMLGVGRFPVYHQNYGQGIGGDQPSAAS